jgi:hypothetical protein
MEVGRQWIVRYVWPCGNAPDFRRERRVDRGLLIVGAGGLEGFGDAR